MPPRALPFFQSGGLFKNYQDIEIPPTAAKDVSNMRPVEAGNWVSRLGYQGFGCVETFDCKGNFNFSQWSGSTPTGWTLSSCTSTRKTDVLDGNVVELTMTGSSAYIRGAYNTAKAGTHHLVAMVRRISGSGNCTIRVASGATTIDTSTSTTWDVITGTHSGSISNFELQFSGSSDVWQVAFCACSPETEVGTIHSSLNLRGYLAQDSSPLQEHFTSWSSDDVVGWTAGSGGDGDTEHSTSYARITSNVGENKFIYKNITTVASTKYVVHFWIRGITLNKWASITVRSSDGSGTGDILGYYEMEFKQSSSTTLNTLGTFYFETGSGETDVDVVLGLPSFSVDCDFLINYVGVYTVQKDDMMVVAAENSFGVTGVDMSFTQAGSLGKPLDTNYTSLGKSRIVPFGNYQIIFHSSDAPPLVCNSGFAFPMGGNMPDTWHLEGYPTVGHAHQTKGGSFLFAANTYRFPNRIWWSDVDDLYNWDNYKYGESGYADLDDGDGDEIIGIESWRGRLVVFKRQRTYILSGYGSDFTVERVINIGCMSKTSFAKHLDDLYFLSSKGIYKLIPDGDAALQIAGPGLVSREVSQVLEDDGLFGGVGEDALTVGTREGVMWFYSSDADDTDARDTALALYPFEGRNMPPAWTKFSLNFHSTKKITSVEYVDFVGHENHDRLIFGQEDNGTMFYFTQNADLNQPITAYYETGNIAADNLWENMNIKGVDVFCNVKSGNVLDMEVDRNIAGLNAEHGTDVSLELIDASTGDYSGTKEDYASKAIQVRGGIGNTKMFTLKFTMDNNSQTESAFGFAGFIVYVE